MPLWEECKEVGIENPLFYAVSKTHKSKGNGFIYPTSKIAFYCVASTLSEWTLKGEKVCIYADF